MLPMQLASLVRSMVRRHLSDTNHLQFKHQLSFNNFIAQHRTIKLEVPRQTGKTTALCELFRSRPSVLVVPKIIMLRNLPPDIMSDHRVCVPQQLERVRNILLSSREKLDQLLVDEHTLLSSDQRHCLREFICSIQGHVSDNFMVIQMGT